MPNFRRAFVPGGTFFFTVVTADRRPILCTESGRPILRRAMAACRDRWAFDLAAVVLLPDHLHSIWTLPDGDTDFSKRWAWIKREFTKRYLATGGNETPITAFERTNRNRGVWQRRFYEHAIRDQADFHRHLDYVHYNPVKHRLAACPHGWEHSSFEKWVGRGVYERDWGVFLCGAGWWGGCIGVGGRVGD